MAEGVDSSELVTDPEAGEVTEPGITDVNDPREEVVTEPGARMSDKERAGGLPVEAIVKSMRSRRQKEIKKQGEENRGLELEIAREMLRGLGEDELSKKETKLVKELEGGGEVKVFLRCSEGLAGFEKAIGKSEGESITLGIYFDPEGREKSFTTRSELNTGLIDYFESRDENVDKSSPFFVNREGYERLSAGKKRRVNKRYGGLLRKVQKTLT